MKENNYKMETNSSEEQLSFRERIKEMLKTSPLPLEHLMCNMALYIRSSALVKYLVINELYEKIIKQPGVIMEFGTWWGQNLILFENFRAIYEPFNKTRKIIGFDTFDGYKGMTEHDSDSDVFSDGGYSVDSDYQKYLMELLEIHEGMNVLGHIRGRHTTVKGDVVDTVIKYFDDHPETIVSLAYFDMGLYKPTKIALENVLKHVVPGSVILLDGLTWDEAPGEAIAFKEVFADTQHKYEISLSRYTPERSIITIKS